MTLKKLAYSRWKRQLRFSFVKRKQFKTGNLVKVLLLCVTKTLDVNKIYKIVQIISDVYRIILKTKKRSVSLIYRNKIMKNSQTKTGLRGGKIGNEWLSIIFARGVLPSLLTNRSSSVWLWGEISLVQPGAQVWEPANLLLPHIFSRVEKKKLLNLPPAGICNKHSFFWRNLEP